MCLKRPILGSNTRRTHEFGKNGKPYYFSGPYDNPEKIIAKLRESVGEGNFKYTIGMDLGMGTVL